MHLNVYEKSSDSLLNYGVIERLHTVNILPVADALFDYLDHQIFVTVRINP